jgi:hypothetical protein
MFAAARPRNIDLRPTARTDIALRGWQCRTRTQECRRKYPFERSHRFPVIQPNSGRETIRVRAATVGGAARAQCQDLGRMLALAGIAAIFCRSLSACRRPLHCRLVESEKPTASPQRSPETQIDHRPDGLRRRPPCCFSVASWSLRTRRHGVISDFEWTFVHFCSCLPSIQIMTRPLARFAPSA